MNKLPITKKVQIINMLVEGSSMRSTSGVCDVSINTVTKLLVDVGTACQLSHNKMVVGLTTKKIQVEEIWSFVYSKEKNVEDNKNQDIENAGDAWTWTAIDADSKLIIDFFVGQRDAESAGIFMNNVAMRLTNRVQLTSDGLNLYPEAVTDAFGSRIDFAQLVKSYGSNDNGTSTEKKYSPAVCTGAKKTVVVGTPNEKDISTSFVERQNLTIRMSNRRFTRLTNAFSKKIDNHCHALALHFVYYNFVRQHKTLRITPAMAAGLTKRFMSIEDIVKLAEF